MKYSVVLFSLLQASLIYCGTRPSFISDDIIDGASTFVKTCLNETGVALDDIEAVRNGQWPESEPLKCYMFCLWKEFGLVEKKELSLNGMLTFFQRIPAYREEVQRAIWKCKAIGKYLAHGDDCQYAYTFNKCYAELSPRTYYLF